MLAARGPRDRRVRRDRRLPLLRPVRGDADPDLLPDRRLRRRRAARYAAMKFLIYSLLGGLLMLASVIGLYVVSAQTAERPDVPALRARAVCDMDTSTGRWLFLGFFVAFAIKAPMFPVHTWLPDAADEAHPGHLGAAGQHPRQDRHVRHDPLLPRAVPGGLDVGDPGRDGARRVQRSSTAPCWRSARRTSPGSSPTPRCRTSASSCWASS